MPCGTTFEHRLRDLFLALPDYPADSSPRDLEGLGDLAEALATSTVTKQGGPVDVERPATDMPALESGAPHTGPDPLDDQVPLQLRDGSDDNDNGPTQRTAGIEVLTEADKLDAEMVELI